GPPVLPSGTGRVVRAGKSSDPDPNEVALHRGRPARGRSAPGGQGGGTAPPRVRPAPARCAPGCAPPATWAKMSSVTDTSPLRAARAAAFTSVCVGVSAIGHAMSGGHHVPAAGLAAAAGPVFALGSAGTARERGLGAVTARLAWIQLALHLVLSAAQSLAGGSGRGAPARLSAAAETSAQGGGSMIAAHAAAV